MLNRLSILLLLLCVAQEAWGHAVLYSPRPWWGGPSRTRPCGGANYTSQVGAIWPAGSNQSILWHVVAGDGMGQVHARLDVNAKTNNFSNAIQVPIKQSKFTELKIYRAYFIVPNVQCKGFNNTCSMQFFTDSGGGWYSCATVQIVCTNCQGGIPTSRDDCVDAGKLDFCSSKDNTQVLVPDGQTAMQIDGLTSNTFNLNHKNPLVFSNGNSSTCMPLYQEFLCELYLSPCGDSKSSYTRQKCQKVLDTCGITEEHQYLYNCSIFPTTSQSSSSFLAPLQWLLLSVYAFALFI